MKPLSAKAPLLAGKKGLIVGIANDKSIAWGCARAFHALGAELALTYLSEKAKQFVAPLAAEVEASILMPMDVQAMAMMGEGGDHMNAMVPMCVSMTIM